MNPMEKTGWTPFPNSEEAVKQARTVPKTTQTEAEAYRLAFMDDDFMTRRDVRPIRLQLELLLRRRVLGVQVLLEDALGEAGFSLDGAVVECVAKGEKQEVDGRESLLPVDDGELADGTLDLVDDRPEEVGGPVLDDRLHQIIEQLRAV